MVKIGKSVRIAKQTWTVAFISHDGMVTLRNGNDSMTVHRDDL